jgi:excisionase family DNA binding protein
MAMVIDGHEFYTTAEACGLLGVKPATLYAYVSRGLLRSYRQGLKRQRLYRRSEVEALRAFKPTTSRGDRGGGRDTSPELPSAESWIPYT